ncbi:MAG: hypothetical protein BGO54_13845 [Sphingobacteriales bacterium 46-32]|nr:MAG: hypothetical protein BGO54_13845 [Sphingobacteriales bacterium 46-32]
MDIRSADATLKGYFYQFNKTIEEILSLKKDNDTITVEGIEDVDIDSINGRESVQCKYYSSQALTNSSIKDPIILMLDHHRNPSSSTVSQYTLYGYFKNEAAGSIKQFDIEELKTILTYKEKKVKKEYHVDNNIDDATLSAFLTKFRLITGKDFEDHRGDCINLLKTHFKSTSFEAENYHYNNAVRTVFDLAIKRKLADRIVSKKDFLKQVDCGRILFYSWYKRYQSDQKYLDLLRKGLKETNLFSPGKEKLLFLGKCIDFNTTAMPLPTFVEEMVTKYFRLGSVKYTARPLTMVVDLDVAEMQNLKKNLITRHVHYNDGYESIQFSSDSFCSDPVINRQNTGAGKITKSSFVIRIISKSTFDSHHKAFTKSFSVLAISEDNFDYPHFNRNQLVEAKYLTKLNDIHSIL